MTNIKLQDLIAAIEMSSDEIEHFIHRNTGEIVLISDDVLSIMDDEEELASEFQDEETESVKKYLAHPEDYISAPSQHDVNEYDMMENFAASLENKVHAQLLLVAISSKGAFRRFKDTVNTLGIEQAWYRFRDEAYKQFALEWCADNGFEVI